MRLKKLLRLAMLAAVSLILYLVEAQIPAPIPVPGVKLGLGNVIVLCVLFRYGRLDALGVLLVKVLLGAILTGTFGAIPYALTGGLLSLGVMCLLKGLFTDRQLWIASVIGAMFHNLGQLAAAAVISSTPGIFAYLPVLLLSGMATGLFTGVAAQAIVSRLRKEDCPADSPRENRFSPHHVRIQII